LFSRVYVYFIPAFASKSIPLLNPGANKLLLTPQLRIGDTPKIEEGVSKVK